MDKIEEIATVISDKMIELGYGMSGIETDLARAAYEVMTRSDGEDRVRACQQERILEWMCGKLRSGDYPVLLSNMRHEMGARFNEDAFDDLVRGGTIKSECPEAKLGDSGRQFWGFAHTFDAALTQSSVQPDPGGDA